ncbi:MAG: hypothetical protein KKD44_28585 [Proteobacteria bacterium]|nr:hypothetical protein [Pseudomonadota bacterium]
MIKSIIALWTVLKWLRKQKKDMEKSAANYLTEHRAKQWRYDCEEIFSALAKGNDHFEKLPKVVQWFFRQVEADNKLGEFGMWFLKSSRLDKQYNRH